MTYIHQYYTTILILLCYPAITSTAYHSGHAITTVTVVSNQGIDTDPYFTNQDSTTIRICEAWKVDIQWYWS